MTTDPDCFEVCADSVELWSLGHRSFPAAARLSSRHYDWPEGMTLEDTLGDPPIHYRPQTIGPRHGRILAPRPRGIPGGRRAVPSRAAT